MNLEIINHIKREFNKRFNEDPLMVAAPGRINLIGEHVDYNQGLVFPAAIDKYIYGAISLAEKSSSHIVALDKNESLEINLNAIVKHSEGHWGNYISGVVSGIQKRGKKIHNFNYMFAGDIPLGAGLSSSAALENSIAFSLNELLKLEFTREELIKISLEAEHEFAGVECGIMDQTASMKGKADHAILLNCKDFSYSLIPLNLADYQLILINTNVKHVLSDSPYNERKNQCKEGLQILQLKYPELGSLAEAKLLQLEECKSKMSNVVYNRSLFVIEEVRRVKEAKVAVLNQEWERFGELLYASHDGLRNLYEVSCPELDFLVDFTRDKEAILGSRMMGGGFGGCTLNLVKKTGMDNFIATIVKKYESKFVLQPDTYLVKTSNGTQLIEF